MANSKQPSGKKLSDMAHTYLPTFFGAKKEEPLPAPEPHGSIGPVPSPAASTPTPAATPESPAASGALAEALGQPTEKHVVKKGAKKTHEKEVKEEPKKKEVEVAMQKPKPEATSEITSEPKPEPVPEPRGSIGPVPAPASPVSAPAPEPAPSAAPPKRRKLATGGGLKAILGAIGNIGIGHERALFIESLATMLDAGLPLMDCLRTLEAEARSKHMKKIVASMRTGVENGQPLWRSMEEQHLFSPHALALVRIGEEAGSLAKNMQQLAVQEEKDRQLKSKVKMAMIYPVIVCTLMFIIVMGLGIFVLPQLVGVLFSLNVPLPFVTRMVILFSEIMTKHGVVIVPGSIGVMILMVFLAKFTGLRVVFQWVLFKVPGVGKLAKEATVARFGVILGGLLQAGVPVIEAMQSLIDVTPIVSYRRFYEKLLEHVQLGDSFAKSFEAIPNTRRILPPSVQQLVMTGEKSGALATIMLKIAEIYDRKASETAQKLPIVLEPMLLLIIGGLVGTIAFAIIVPIYSIVGNVGR